MFHLHEEEFQVLAGCVLIGREEVKPVTWPLGYVTTSRHRGAYRLRLDTQSQRKEETVLTSAGLRM